MAEGVEKGKRKVGSQEIRKTSSGRLLCREQEAGVGLGGQQRSGVPMLENCGIGCCGEPQQAEAGLRVLSSKAET